MNTQRIGLVLTVVNLLLLGLLVSQIDRPLQAQNTPPMLRGRGLEIVDAQGRVRASISVIPEEPETVLLRLITVHGRPAVKISTSDKGGSGLALAGPTGTHQTYVTVGTRDTSTRLTMKNEDGRERTISP